MTNRLRNLIVIFVLILGLLPRLYRLNSPVADWHSHRQADTASVTKNFLEKGIDLLHPTYHDLSNLQSGQENPHGYRFVEFPIYNLASLSLYRLTAIFTPLLTLETASRLVSILFSLGTGLLIFLLVYRLGSDFLSALLSMAAFLFLPFSIYYSRCILPESTAVFFMVLSLYLFPKHLLFSALSLSASILVKPYTALILFPVFAFMLLNRFRDYLNPKKAFSVLVFLVISFLPFILWRWWMQSYPEGIPSNKWLLTTDLLYAGLDWYKGIKVSRFLSIIAFRPYWFRWLFYERLGLLILGAFGLIPLFLGFTVKSFKLKTLIYTFFAGVLIYFIFIARGNIQHDYYQVLVIPAVAIAVGNGLAYICHHLFGSKAAGIVAALMVSLFTLTFSLNLVKDYFRVNNPVIVDAGREINRLIPSNALVVAPYNGDTAFLYQTGRSGWPIEVYNFGDLIKAHPGSSIFLASVNFDNYTNQMIDKYPTLYRNDQFIILQVTP